MLKKYHLGIATFIAVVLTIVVALLSGMTTPTPVSAAEPTPTPCMDCEGNWDRDCTYDGDNFTRHDAVPAELIIGLPNRSSVYELTWPGEDGAFSDGIVRIVVQLGKGQMRFTGGFTTNGYCYYGSGKEVTTYLSSGQAGHVRGLQYCTDLTQEYIPTVLVDPVNGAVTILVPGNKGPSISEIQKHLVPLVQPAAAQPPAAAAPAAAPAAAQPAIEQAPAAVEAPEPAAAQPAQPPAVKTPTIENLPWGTIAILGLCCILPLLGVICVLVVIMFVRKTDAAANATLTPPPAYL